MTAWQSIGELLLAIIAKLAEGLGLESQGPKAQAEGLETNLSTSASGNRGIVPPRVNLR